MEKLDTDTKTADTILNRMQRTATERMDENPAFYRRFSEPIKETVQVYREGRISQAEDLQRAEEQLGPMRTSKGNGQHERLGRYRHAAAYYEVLREPLVEYDTSDGQVAGAGVKK